MTAPGIPARRTTPRGFTIYDQFTDGYRSEIRVQESSSAEDARVWIFAEPPNLDDPPPAPHLDVEQAKRVRDALDAFIREHEATP
jgi:hypothetical protein